MPNNEFDQIFRDRLKDYSSPVHAVIWRRIRADWGRRHLFHTRWGWGLTGGAAVVVVAVIAGYWIIRPGKPMATHAAAVRVETSASRPVDGFADRATAGSAERIHSGSAGPATAGVTGPATAGVVGLAAAGSAKSIAADSVERTTASSTERMSDRSPERILFPGGSGVASRTAAGAAARQGQESGDQGSHGYAAKDRRRQGYGSDRYGSQSYGSQSYGPQRGESRGRQGLDQDHEGLDHEGLDREGLDHETSADAGQRGGATTTGAGRFSLHVATMPSLVRLSSRAAIYATPIKPSLAALSRQKSRASRAALHDSPGRLYVGIYGSPDIPTKQFALSYTAGVRMTMLLTKHFFVTAGLQYSKAYTNRNLVKEGTANGGVSPYPVYFSNLDLPVLVGYTVGNGRFRGAVTTGAIFNLFSHATGNFGWPWPNRTGPSAYLGLDLSWELNDRFALFAEPYGRCMWSGYFSLFPSQTYTGGALIGIRYNFGSRFSLLRR